MAKHNPINTQNLTTFGDEKRNFMVAVREGIIGCSL